MNSMEGFKLYDYGDEKAKRTPERAFDIQEQAPSRADSISSKEAHDLAVSIYNKFAQRFGKEEKMYEERTKYEGSPLNTMKAALAEYRERPTDKLFFPERILAIAEAYLLAEKKRSETSPSAEIIDLAQERQKRKGGSTEKERQKIIEGLRHAFDPSDVGPFM